MARAYIFKPQNIHTSRGKMDYLAALQLELGIPIWLIIVIFVWSAIWKIAALWKSARKGHVAWFIIIFLLNTVGILEILYIYIFSEITTKKSKKKIMKKTVKKKK